MTARVEHEAAIAKIAQFTANAEPIRKHLAHILESQTFKGSRRCQEFLRYIVEKSLSGEFDDLKERILGVEIFGRPVTYDTSADAIVRVTANEVRKRLLRYYELEGPGSEFRISLSSGSYLPEFSQANLELPPVSDTSTAEAIAPVRPAHSTIGVRPSNRIRLPVCIALGFVLGLCLGTVIWKQNGRPPLPKLVVPWSAIFQNGLPTQLIFCDTSIEMLQEYLHTSISLADYANRRLLPNPESLGADATRAAGMLGGADFTVTTAPVDLGISTRISELAQTYGRHIRVRSARELHFRDFKTDGNFILLGSPRSNPWTALFQDQLDFYFAFDAARNQEVCRNRHPKGGELAQYVPTARGGGTGEAFAIVAFIGNFDQNGNILILAGSNAEGTEASAKFITDLSLLSKTLRKYGLPLAGAPPHFEALLRLTTMAGSPNRFEVAALHVLDDTEKQ